ncbi:hypothetical protein MNBD_GAMMA17-1847 [hydrothermal vent metagenome]|uniref:Uncharacterized protein n=1 Tax=hydrothermal vent metagenome TaxID=652676 RepID=A0A3B0ZLH0_9ZZZZ
MSSNILNQLQELQKQSNRRLNPVIMSYLSDHSNPRALVKSELVANGQFSVKPCKGASSLATQNNRQSKRKVSTFSTGSEHIANKLNKELLGGESYPILTTALGIASGVISGGASLIFTLTTTGLALSNTTSKVLARPGDEIWHIEEIGKVGNKAVYVSAFFIVDPFRKQAINKGWLIHEEREELTLS